MKLTALYKMPFSRDAIWPDLARADGTANVPIFWRLVLPLSILPPAMIYMAGSYYGDAFMQGYSAKSWGWVALFFFLAEIVSVTLMGWLIKQVAQTWHGHIDYPNAYVLAAIAPIPLWLSSLGLLVPSLGFNMALSAGALMLSSGLIYQGVHTLCNVKEDVEAAAITQAVFGAGFIIWGLMIALLAMPASS